MNNEQLRLLTSMREELGRLGTFIKVKNAGASSKRKALSHYDGKGKIFEGFLMLRLMASLDAAGAVTAIIDGEGLRGKPFVIRGAPGLLRRDDRYGASFIEVIFGDKRLEVHNSLIWPDHMVHQQGHEIDIAVADTANCERLVRWRLDWDEPLARPIMGIEAKFRSGKPDRELGRSLTGLAILVRMHLLYLISLTPATDPIRRQVEALTNLRYPSEIVDSSAFHVTLLQGVVDTSFMDNIVRRVRYRAGVRDPLATLSA